MACSPHLATATVGNGGKNILCTIQRVNVRVKRPKTSR